MQKMSLERGNLSVSEGLKFISLIALGLFLFSLSFHPSFAQTGTSISLNLDDNVTNPGDTVLVQGNAEEGGSPLTNRVVNFYLDGSLQEVGWSQSSGSDWNSGTFEKMLNEEGLLKLSYKEDKDILYIDNSTNKISWIDRYGEKKNVSVTATQIGGVGDMDKDGDMDVVFTDTSGELKFVDSEGHVTPLGVNVSIKDRFGNGIASEVGDVDNDGWLEVPYQYGTWDGGIGFVDAQGEDNTVGSGGEYVFWPGGLGDIDGDGKPEITWGKSGSGFWGIDISGELTTLDSDPEIGMASGGIGDWDGDGLEEASYNNYDDGALDFIDTNKEIQSVSIPYSPPYPSSEERYGSRIGSMRDFNADGNLDIVYRGSNDAVYYAEESGQANPLGVNASWVGGIGDIDMDTGYWLDGSYVSQVHDWRSDSVKVENIYLEFDTNLPENTTVTPVVQVSDSKTFSSIKAEDNLGELTPGSEEYTVPVSLQQARYVRVKLLFDSEKYERSPVLERFTLNANIYTNSSGDYEYRFDSPQSLGAYETKAKIEGDVGTEQDSKRLDVRDLRFEKVGILDNHGQVDGILNPGEKFRPLLKIREYNGENYYDVTSGSLYLMYRPDHEDNHYQLEHWEGSTWRTESQIPAEKSLSEDYSFKADSSGESGDYITGSTQDIFYEYKVRSGRVTFEFADEHPNDLKEDVVNRSENITISGEAILKTSGYTAPMEDKEIQLSVNGSPLATVQTDNLGEFNHKFTASEELGRYDVEASVTNPDGIHIENTEPYWVKTLTLTTKLYDSRGNADNTFVPGDPITVAGYATLWPNGDPDGNGSMKVYVGPNNENFENFKETATQGSSEDNGYYSLEFNAPSQAGQYRVQVTMKDQAGIENENFTAFKSETISISTNLDDNEVPPYYGETRTGITMSGTARYQPSGKPVKNTKINLWMWEGALVREVYTNENGDYDYTFEVPENWGFYTVSVHIESKSLVGDGSVDYAVKDILTTLRFDDIIHAYGQEEDVKTNDNSILNKDQSFRVYGRTVLKPDNEVLDGISVRIYNPYQDSKGSYDYLLTDENGYYETWLTSPSDLGIYSVSAESSGKGSNEDYSGENTREINTREIHMTVNLSNSQVDGGDSIKVYGNEYVRKEDYSEDPVIGKWVYVYVDDEYKGRDLTSSDGSYDVDITTPFDAGIHTVSVVGMSKNGIKGTENTPLFVERILISEAIDKNPVNTGDLGGTNTVSGYVEYEYSGESVDNEVIIYMDGDYFDSVRTNPDTGYYEKTLNSPNSLGTHSIRVTVKDQEFDSENTKSFMVRRLDVPINFTYEGGGDIEEVILEREQNFNIAGEVTVSPGVYPVPSGTPVEIRSWQPTDIIYTGSEGHYTYSLTAPDYLGSFNVNVSAEEQDNGIRGSKSGTISVRKLRYHYPEKKLLDNHGQYDENLNPGENYRLFVEIDEYDGSEYTPVKEELGSNPFKVEINGDNYDLEHTENDIWRSESIVAETDLGIHQFNPKFSGSSSHRISENKNLSISYEVEKVNLSVNLDPVVNPREIQRVSGRVMLSKENKPLRYQEVKIWLDENLLDDEKELLDDVVTDGSGDYSLKFQSPSSLGEYHIILKGKSPQGIEMGNSSSFWVKTIEVSENIAVTAVMGMNYDNVTGIAVLQPDNTKVRFENILITGSGVQNEIHTQTGSDGLYSATFKISNQAKTRGYGQVDIIVRNGDNIIGVAAENIYTGTPAKLRGVSRTAKGSPIQAKFIFDSTNGRYHFEISTNEEGKYEGVIVENKYNMSVQAFGDTATFRNVTKFVGIEKAVAEENWPTFDNLVELDSIPVAYTPISENIQPLKSTAIQVKNLTTKEFDTASLTMNLHPWLSMIDNWKTLRIYKAPWDIHNRERTGKWETLNGSVDRIEDTITVSGLENFSVFTAAEHQSTPFSGNLENIETALENLQGLSGIDELRKQLENIEGVNSIENLMFLLENLRGKLKGIGGIDNLTKQLENVEGIGSIENLMKQFENVEGIGGLGDLLRRLENIESIGGMENLARELENVKGISGIGDLLKKLEGIEGVGNLENLENIFQGVKGIRDLLDQLENLEGPDPVELGSGGQQGLDLDLYQGETTSVSIDVRNNLRKVMNLKPKVRGEVARFVMFGEENLTLKPRQSKKLTIIAQIPSNQPPRLYTGEIALTENLAGVSLSKLPIRIHVISSSPGDVSLDMNMLSDKVRPGDNLEIEVTIRNNTSRPTVKTDVTAQLIHFSEPTVVSETKRTYVVGAALTDLISLHVPENADKGDYRVRVQSSFENDKELKGVIKHGSIKVETTVPFLDKEFGPLSMAVILTIAIVTTSAGTGGYLYYRRRKTIEEEQRRYEKPVAPEELPSKGSTAAWFGKVAETDNPGYIDLNDLKTHIMVAGATGAGKTIMAQDMVEEALERGVNIFVFDPTSQWTGFLKELQDEEMFEHYDKFDMGKNDARGYAGKIKIVRDPKEYINMGNLLQKDPEERDEGKIYVFDVSELESKDMDTYVANTVNDIFRSNPKERGDVKDIIVYDEVHRLLPRFGGEGLGLTMLERGVREFRKWGIGIMLVSQVIGDFESEMRANIRTQIQLWTRDEDELERISEKFGHEHLQSISKAKVGQGMVFNSDYNKGRPYYIQFRPIKHHLSKLDDEVIEKYDEYGRELEEIRTKMDKLKEEGVDVFDVETEYKLAEDKLEEGSFNVVDLYLQSIKPSVEERIEENDITIEKKEMVSEDELREARKEAKSKLEEMAEEKEEEEEIEKEENPDKDLEELYEEETGKSPHREDGRYTEEFKDWRREAPTGEGEEGEKESEEEDSEE